jgi:hypothetical protein
MPELTAQGLDPTDTNHAAMNAINSLAGARAGARAVRWWLQDRFRSGEIRAGLVGLMEREAGFGSLGHVGMTAKDG